MIARRGNILLLVLLAVAAIAASGALGFWWRQRQGATTPAQAPTEKQTNSQAQDETTNWKTYTNTKNLYSIKIPPDWQLDRRHPGGQYTDEQLQVTDSISWLKKESRFSIQILPDCSSILQECFKKVQSIADKNGGPYTTKDTSTQTETYLGQTTLVARSSYKVDSTVKGVFLVQKGKFWLFETQSPVALSGATEKETDQILSTFKFIDESNYVTGIQLNTCCPCPEKVAKDQIGKDRWVIYEQGKDYSSQTPSTCGVVACKPCEILK